LLQTELLSYQFIFRCDWWKLESDRLGCNLLLKLQKPEPAAENRVPGPGLKVTETKDELILLCKQIESFVRNPIIDKPGTVDAQQLEKARRDLESVVELSSDIKKRADKQKH